MRGKKIRVVTVAMSMALVVALGGVLVHSQIDAKASKVDTGVVVEQSVGELVNGIEVKINSKVDLYDTNENVAAEYYETPSGGYVIFDNEDEVVEQSDINNRYIDKNKKQYYFGPFEYYEKQDNGYRNLASNEIVAENVMASAQDDFYDLVALNDYSEIDDIQVATASTDIEETGSKNAKRKLSARYANKSIYSLDQLLGTDNTVYKITKEKLKKNYPTIVGIDGHKNYDTHWAVATGIKRYKKNGEYSYFYVINDGWGNLDVEIAKKYISSCVYREKK